MLIPVQNSTSIIDQDVVLGNVCWVVEKEEGLIINSDVDEGAEVPPGVKCTPKITLSEAQ